jgi:hypothetical protein
VRYKVTRTTTESIEVDNGSESDYPDMALGVALEYTSDHRWEPDNTRYTVERI